MPPKPKHPVIDGYKCCSRCGISKPHTSEFFIVGSVRRGSKVGAQCKECVSASSNPRMLARWREKYPSTIEGRASWAKKQREFLRTPEGKKSNRNSQLKKKFGVTLDQYDSLLQQQNGSCAICGTTNPRGRGSFHLDHDHITGAIRGILCHSCNTGLGSFRDSTLTIQAAIDYIERQVSGELLYTSATDGDYQALLADQNGDCAICNRGTTGWDRKFHLDHDHNSGLVRGLLCSPCNLGLGAFRDSIQNLYGACQYLDRSIALSMSSMREALCPSPLT
jgi:hypothetical protein